MESWHLLLLAVLQGLTEFLPVSSSGHLALAEHWLRIPEEARLPVTVFLHIGTLLALLVYFRHDLWLMANGITRRDREGLQLLGYVLLANIATAALALPLKHKVEQAFASPKFISLFLVGTAALLFASEWWEVHRRNRHPSTCPTPHAPPSLNWWQALAVGLAQGLSVFPGLSRSGTTIAAGLFCGLGRERAGRFAFLVGIPAILGANLMEAREVAQLSVGFSPLMWATLVAFAASMLAIHWTLLAVRRLKLRWFSLYYLAVAVIAWFMG